MLLKEVEGEAVPVGLPHMPPPAHEDAIEVDHRLMIVVVPRSSEGSDRTAPALGSRPW
jgi:hypothetical protein